ncbi:MAG: Gfo/Idh/MocA family oxidoreductase [Planctomycetia bacterium]|nr:Gfo/Idh/MocA family oxidoreductase [Planctomycetia bacterium]
MNRVALIGCGAIAEVGHLPALSCHPDFTIAAACDTRPDRAGLLARVAGGVPAYVDWRELLDREGVDAAVLALPPEASPEVAIECLRRGIPVLDEKPLAAAVGDGRRVAHAVAESGGVFQVGFVLRYGDSVREVARMAEAVGSPMKIRVAVFDERLDRSDVTHFGRMQGFLRGSSAMTHEGSHVVDYAGLWNPSPWVRLHASAECTEPDFEGPNLWHAEIDLADGSTLDVEIGWLLPDPPPCRVAIEGPNGQLALDPTTGLGRWRIGAESGTLALSPLSPEWGRQYDAFSEAIRRGRAVVATVDDGLRALEVTAACEESARTGMASHRAGLGATDPRLIGPDRPAGPVNPGSQARFGRGAHGTPLDLDESHDRADPRS